MGVLKKECQDRKIRLFSKEKENATARDDRASESVEKHRKPKRKTASQAQHNASPVAPGGQRQNRSLILQVGQEAWVKRYWQS